MKSFSVITNFNIKEKAETAISVCKKLNELGCSVFTANFNKDRIKRNFGDINTDYISFIQPDRLFTEPELVIVIGGDGSILEAARSAAPVAKPILGINHGRLGYMAELEANELSMLSSVVNDTFTIDSRMMLNVVILDAEGNVKTKINALNDAVISNGSVARMVDIQLYETDTIVANYRADGIIVATPTGSTAYSMSAGGAIVDPRLECICVTPICAHSLNSRPLIFPSSANIRLINTCAREKSLFVTVDGRSNYDISCGESVQVTKSALTARLVRLKSTCFYEKLHAKMNTNMN